MDKIMFNDKYGLTDAVLGRQKTMTRRKSALYMTGQIVAIAQDYKTILESEYLPSALETEVCRLVRSKHRGTTNKMFVKGEYMPHHIRILSCKFQHLQDITNEECLKEGIMPYYDGPNGDDGLHQIVGYTFVGGHLYIYDSAKEAFASLINKLNGKGYWESNPRVFAYEFELIN